MIKHTAQRPLLRLRLARDLVRSIKRGHPWVFAAALTELPRAAAGTAAVLLDRQGKEVAKGYYEPKSPIAFRTCILERDQALDETWAQRQLERAIDLRRSLFNDAGTTGYRLVNGEGDSMPGFICDLYGQTAVMQFDGEGARTFWNAPIIAKWLADRLGLQCVWHKFRGGHDQQEGGESLHGEPPQHPVQFLEAHAAFTADVVRGQKTGFFLDQRENRQRIRALASDRRVLNVFGYTGGFSIAAGLGGAREVTTVDIALAALEAATRHWAMNGLEPSRHHAAAADAFEFLEAARKGGERWDLVVLDPPSFAPSQKAVPAALASYQRLIAAGAAVTSADGLLAAASCSSHVRMEDFLTACEEGISDARRRATVLGVHGQPADHPSPLALPEFRYLKFVLMRLEG